MNSLLYCSCLLIFGGVLSTPVPKEKWEQPCAGSNNVSELQPALQEEVSSTPKPVDFEDLFISLSTLIRKSREYKQRMVGNIGNRDVIADLDRQPGLLNFPSERSSGSGLITDSTLLLTEDYGRLSKLFIFVENAKVKRHEHIEEHVEETLLEELENKILETLCKMSASGISLESRITRDILIGNPTPSNGSQRNQFDYVMIKDTVNVLDSIKDEYETLFTFRKTLIN